MEENSPPNKRSRKWAVLDDDILDTIAAKITVPKDLLMFAMAAPDWKKAYDRLLRRRPVYLLAMIKNNKEKECDVPPKYRYKLHTIPPRLYIPDVTPTREMERLFIREVTPTSEMERLIGSSLGWLVFQDAKCKHTWLFSPFTEATLSIQDTTSISASKLMHAGINDTFIKKTCLSDRSPDSNFSNFFLMGIGGTNGKSLTLFNSKDSTWTVVENNFYIHDVVYQEGEFYIVIRDGSVWSIDPRSPALKLKPVTPCGNKHIRGRNYLVFCSGELYLITRRFRRVFDDIKDVYTNNTIYFFVLKFNKQGGKWDRVHSFGQGNSSFSVFIGKNSSFAVSNSEGRSLIYFTDLAKSLASYPISGWRRHDMGVYDLERGRFELYGMFDDYKKASLALWIEAPLEKNAFLLSFN